MPGPPLPAVVAEVAPVIDGDLSDECWQAASKITDFYYLESGGRAGEPTTAWIAYHNRNIYVAFDCKDSRPESVHAQQQKRGGNTERCITILSNHTRG